MSAKNLDKHNRWRNKTVAFRVSPEEDTQIETAVKLTGLTKQDYIIRRLLCRDVVVQGNPRVYKALRDQLAAVLDELRRIEAGQGVNDELLDTIQMIATIMNGMQEDFAYRHWLAALLELQQSQDRHPFFCQSLLNYGVFPRTGHSRKYPLLFFGFRSANIHTYQVQSSHRYRQILNIRRRLSSCLHFSLLKAPHAFYE